MYWDYVQFPDETQIAYSDMRSDGTIGVRIERPIDMGFNTATCLLPAYTWSDVCGFSQEEVAELELFLRDNAPLIYELAQRHNEDEAA